MVRSAFLTLFLISATALAQNKGTPVATTGLPAPMMYDTGDPITLGYPCDASHMGLPYYNLASGVSRPIWLCNGTIWIQAQPAISAVTVSIGGSLLILNSTTSGTATATGAVPGQNCIATRSDGALPAAGTIIDCAVTAANTVTVRLTALIAATPAATTYNVRIFQ